MLYIYIATHCAGCATALKLAQKVQAMRPHVPLTLVDVNNPSNHNPAYIIGTPTYAWDSHILFLGNPSEEELLERIDAIQRHGIESSI